MKLGIYYDNILELSWIKRIFPDVEFHKWQPSLARESLILYRRLGTTPIIIRTDSSSLEFVKLTQFYTHNEIPFEVIHLCDEYGADDLSWYGLKYLTKIYRNYISPRSLSEFPCSSKVIIFPLGPLVYYEGSQEDIPSIADRPLLWSFAGRVKATWREILIEQYRPFQPNELYFFENFMDDQKKGTPEYKNSLLSSKCIPILPGSNL